MFDKDYNFKGCYADKVRFLCSDIEPGKNKYGTFSIFGRYVDVLMCAAIVGFTHNKKDLPDYDDKVSIATIPMKTMIGEQRNLSFIFKSIILCNDVSDIDSLSNDELKEKMDDAFRFGKGTERFEKNWALFESYVFGGINYLYDYFKDVRTREDALDVINEMAPKTIALDYSDVE